MLFSYNPCNHHWSTYYCFHPFYQRGNWGAERLNISPTVTQDLKRQETRFKVWSALRKRYRAAFSIWYSCMHHSTTSREVVTWSKCRHKCTYKDIHCSIIWNQKMKTTSIHQSRAGSVNYGKATQCNICSHYKGKHRAKWGDDGNIYIVLTTCQALLIY